MLFLENLWVRCAPGEWPDRNPRSGIPFIPRQRVDELRAALAPEAEQSIANDQFLDHPMLGSRLYRWRNSVGLTYTGPTMWRFLKDGRLDLIWKIIRGVARSIVPQYRMSFEVAASYADPNAVGASASYFRELLRFAERDFWVEFAEMQRSVYPTVDLPENGDACLIHHISRALETAISEPRLPIT